MILTIGDLQAAISAGAITPSVILSKPTGERGHRCKLPTRKSRSLPTRKTGLDLCKIKGGWFIFFF
jgi:hypothetical protein